MAAALTGPFLLNAVSLFSLLFGIYVVFQLYQKPLLAWKVPLHLSYQKLGTVNHSQRLAQYDAELWNNAVLVCGGIVAGITVAGFQRFRNRPSEPTGNGRRLGTLPPMSNVRFGPNLDKLTVLMGIVLGGQAASSLLGMHTAPWTTTAPIGAVSTAAITDELTRVPTSTPWDMTSVMLRSAFERVVSQKGWGALEVTHRYLSRHLQDGEGVRVGRTVYPTIRTHGVGVAPAPWERRAYRVPLDQGRVVSYAPIVAATNVTAHCNDSTEEWNWAYEVHETPSKEDLETPSEGKRKTHPIIVHQFHVSPKSDWHTRGPNRTVTYIDGDKGINLETWLALQKVAADPDDPESANDMVTHQIFLFTNVGAIDRVPKVILIDCAYGGVDVIRQVTMTSPLEPVVIGEVMATKDPLTMEDIYPAATAIDEALDRDGGAMIAGMAAAKFTSFETWEMFRGRTLELPELIEHILVDTAQAYFSLLRQWREEAQFFSWPREVPAGHLTAATRRVGWDGGAAGLGGLVVLGLLTLLPLVALTKMSRNAWIDYSQQRQFSERFELKDGVIRRKFE